MNDYTVITPMNATLVSLTGDDITIRITDGDAERFLDKKMTGGKPILFSFNNHYIEPVSYNAPNLSGKLLTGVTVSVTTDSQAQ